jgi:glycosyltransferase involved in cell wall biosynthesis
MSSGNPLVSVIVPSYNRSAVLPLCLRALAEQTYAPIEVIVVDDCSTDDSAQVARAAGATVFSTPVNSGAAAARNLGAAHASGHILLFVDGDIALDPDAVANAVSTLESDPGLGAVGGILSPEPLVSRSLASQYRALQAYYWWMPTHRPTTLELHAAVLAVPAAVWDEVGPFNPDLPDTVSADYRYRLTRQYRVRITADVRGRHDHDSTIAIIVRKVFRRARASAREWRRGETPGDSVPRAFAGALLLATVLAVPVPFLVGVAGVTLPLALVAGAVALDFRTYRRVFADRGPWFGSYFSVVHLLVTFVGALGGAIGTVQRLLLPRPAPPASHQLGRSVAR